MSDIQPTIPDGEPLAEELDTFNFYLPNLLETDLGRYALVKGEAVESTWETENDAIDVGYRTWGAKTPFLVKQILPVEVPIEITRITVPESNPNGY